MARCIGNCAVCELDVDKPTCCQFQTLRLLVEVKALLKEVANKPAPALKTIADLEPIKTITDDDTRPESSI